jgi:uracil-DNA glycosylase
MSYDEHCKNCPYNNQIHLNNGNKTDRKSPPIELENNKSDILLVFQAPGIEEWVVGKAIKSNIKQGGTVGRRIELSWRRKGKKRNNFDIINTVQCFPGRKEDRDLKPDNMSIFYCSNRLENILKTNKQYNKIILFGEIAQSVGDNLIKKLKLEVDVVKSKHPAGGLSNENLDNLW